MYVIAFDEWRLHCGLSHTKSDRNNGLSHTFVDRDNGLSHTTIDRGSGLSHRMDLSSTFSYFFAENRKRAISKAD